MSTSMIEWHTNGNVYQYSVIEQIIMVFITGISNLSILPAIILVYRRNLIFQTFIGVLTILSSFTYHMMESIGMLKFFLTDLEWHRLDNIGSIMSITMLLVYLGDLKSEDLETHINYWIFFIVLILQEAQPWNINYTLAPIFLNIAIIVIIKIKQKSLPQYNKRIFQKGVVLFIIAAINFYFGLEERKDYLRFYHGMWHIFVGLQAFYLWQAKQSNENQFSLRTVFMKGQYIDDKFNLE